MGTIAIGTIDIAGLLIGGIGAQLLPKIFGGAKTACSETGVTKDQIKAKLEALKAECDKAIASLG